ncbi:MAG TPA: serine protease [Candidatus Binatus sp.]|jgi:S1-C subfamily serine protease|nr:serine protease [Candidatus Binatus sp.]
MFPKAKRSAVLILGLTIFACLGLKARSQPQIEATPSLETLKTIDYTRAGDGNESDAIGYAKLRDFINACQAYSSGLGVLPNFHEPVLTRGDSGIAVFRKVSPSVVLVLTAKFKDDKVTDSGLGTGVIVDPAGYVLTNWHVVAGYDGAIVFFKPTIGTEPDKNSAYGVTLVALDKQADLALLKIVKPPSGLTAVQFEALSMIQVAEDIHIIGHPHGNLWSYSSGVISQIRDNYDWKYEDGSQHNARVLQMQTAINPGNSGGPVLDNDSKMLGLVAMSEEGQNLNYAVAIDVIKNFVNSSLATRSRGAETHNETEKGETYVGRSKEGFSIIKTVYSDLVSYSVRDAKGLPTELVAETSDGIILTGSKPNAFGGFGEWKFKPRAGKPIFVKSSGNSPDLVSAGKGN